MELCQGCVGLDVWEELCTWGWWVWNEVLRAIVMAPGYWRSRSAGTMLRCSVWFFLGGWSCVEPEVRLNLWVPPSSQYTFILCVYQRAFSTRVQEGLTKFSKINSVKARLNCMEYQRNLAKKRPRRIHLRECFALFTCWFQLVLRAFRSQSADSAA